MSYAGYYQNICSNGHKAEVSSEVEYGYSNTPKCKFCGEKIVFSNSVDQTNCEEWGIILEEDWNKVFLLTPDEYQVCNLNCSHLIKPATYRIPTKEELSKYRMYFDQNDQKYKPIKDQKYE